MALETERRKAGCDPHHTACDARPLGDRSDALGETRSDVEAEAESKARLRLELFEPSTRPSTWAAAPPVICANHAITVYPNAPRGSRGPAAGGSTIGPPHVRWLRHRYSHRIAPAHRSAVCRERGWSPRAPSPRARSPTGARENARTTASVAPRRATGRPAFSLRSRTCFSIKVALAGKIAVKARNRPPMTGPRRAAIRPATTVIAPPSTNLARYPYQRVLRRAEALNWTIMRVLAH